MYLTKVAISIWIMFVFVVVIILATGGVILALPINLIEKWSEVTLLCYAWGKAEWKKKP